MFTLQGYGGTNTCSESCMILYFRIQRNDDPAEQFLLLPWSSDKHQLMFTNIFTPLVSTSERTSCEDTNMATCCTHHGSKHGSKVFRCSHRTRDLLTVVVKLLFWKVCFRQEGCEHGLSGHPWSTCRTPACFHLWCLKLFMIKIKTSLNENVLN